MSGEVGWYEDEEEDTDDRDDGEQVRIEAYEGAD